MKKISIGSTIGDTFSIYFKSLPNLFKNNWLLFLLVALINAAIVFHFKNNMETGAFEAHDFANVINWLMNLPAIFSILLVGYTYRYVVNKENKPIGWGGLYINMPLIKMFVSLILTGLLIGVVTLLIVGVIALMAHFMMGSVPVDALHETAQQLISSNPLAAVSMGVVSFVGIIFLIFLGVRLVLVGPYSFLHNQVVVLKAFPLTKCNVWRIIISSIVISIAYIIAMGCWDF